MCFQLRVFYFNVASRFVVTLR